MRARLKLIVGLMFVFAVLSSFASADFSVGKKGYEIAETYGPSAPLSGWINISLDEEKSNSILKTQHGDGLTLIDFLDINSLYPDSDYNCSPSTCESGYELSNGKTSKVISIESGKSAIIGFKLQGRITGINSSRFDIESNAEESCISPIALDITNDGDVNWYFNKASDEFTCSNSKGCFGNSTSERKIDDKKHCEKINLELKPAYKIGAWIRKNGTSSLKAYLYSLNMNRLASCNLSDAVEAGGGSQLYN